MLIRVKEGRVVAGFIRTFGIDEPMGCYDDLEEADTFAHSLPADLVVTNEAHRKHAGQIRGLPAGTIPDWVGAHAVLQHRKLKDGEINACWVQCANNMQASPNMNEQSWPGYRNPDNFIVVSDPYPTVTAMAADLILPTAMWAGKEGAYGNAERRTRFWRQQVRAPGEAKGRVFQAVHHRRGLARRIAGPAARSARQDAL